MKLFNSATKLIFLGLLGVCRQTVAKKLGGSEGADERNLQGYGITAQICYSSHAMADVRGKGQVAMSDLMVGDEVLTGSGKYEPVYSMVHRHPTKSATFFQMHTSADEKPLEISEKHMIFLEGNPNPVPADMLKIGDQVHTLDGPRDISKITTIERDGVFNPVTPDGTMVVNGVVTSVFSSFFGDEWIEVAGTKIMTWQSFFDKGTKPYRLMCTGISLELCKTSNERVGILQLCADIAGHWEQQSAMYQASFLAAMLLFVQIVDLVLSPCGLFAAILTLGYLVSKKNIKSKTA
jgi:hypothetical protein